MYVPTAVASLRSARLANLRSARPSLTIHALSGTGASGLRGIVVRLPAGLRLNPGGSRQITVTGARATRRILGRHRLVLFTRATRTNTQVSIMIKAGALSKTTRFEKRLRQLESGDRASRSIRAPVTVGLFDGDKSARVDHITFTVT